MPSIKANGINIHYEEIGSGEPLLLIMGLGADGSLWAQHVDVYKDHFRCIMMDNRGSGRSDKPDGPYTIKQMADDAVGLLDALNIIKAHISGISMGGAIAQEIAINNPERVLTATLISTWAQCDTYATRIFEMFKETIIVADKINFTRLLQLWIFTPDYHNKEMDDLLKREIEGGQYQYPMPQHAFLAQCDACIAHDTTDRLNNIVAPTLITVGEEDIFTPLKFSRHIAEHTPNNELYIVHGGGHAHHWEKLDEFNDKTLSFLMECSEN
jgi:pimeloyl-ACP methyl ester carboxylesterase